MPAKKIFRIRWPELGACALTSTLVIAFMYALMEGISNA